MRNGGAAFANLGKVFQTAMNSTILGRPASIDESFFDTVFRLHEEGKGYQRISNELMALGVSTSKSSVARFLKAKGIYRDRPEPGG